jgi:hypothetical protein
MELCDDEAVGNLRCRSDAMAAPPGLLAPTDGPSGLGDHIQLLSLCEYPSFLSLPTRQFVYIRLRPPSTSWLEGDKLSIVSSISGQAHSSRVENACTICRSIFTGHGLVACPKRPHPQLPKGYYHHRTLASLENAAQGGCDICHVFLRNSPDAEKLSMRLQPISYHLYHDHHREGVGVVPYTVSFRMPGERI